SDSEGRHQGRKFPVPHWAESPELRQQLVAQQTMDPEEVFGPMAPLQMEEIFKGAGNAGRARFRNRTSSANWDGADKLTRAEIEADAE
ncbi:inner centromere protein, partial [Kalaharituber pfeilii]